MYQEEDDEDKYPIIGVILLILPIMLIIILILKAAITYEKHNTNCVNSLITTTKYKYSDYNIDTSTVKLGEFHSRCKIDSTINCYAEISYKEIDGDYCKACIWYDHLSNFNLKKD